MDDDAIVERIRTDADLLDHSPTDVDALVGRAVFQGRRRRTRRRVAGAVTSAVAAGVAVALLAGVPSSVHSGPRVVPAAPSPVVSTTSSPTPTPTRTPKPVPPTPPNRVSGTPTQVERTLEDLLPNTATVTRASHARDTNTDGFAWEHTTALTVHDARGTSYVLGGIGDGTYDDGCLNLPDCTKTTLAGGGTLWITHSPGGDKSGADLTFSYNRPHGGHLWLTERNYGSGSGPVTRDGLLLTRAEGRALVTSAVWDSLFQG